MTNKSDMADTIIQCLECGADIPVSQVLLEQLRRELEQSLRAEHRRRLRETTAMYGELRGIIGAMAEIPALEAETEALPEPEEEEA